MRNNSIKAQIGYKLRHIQSGKIGKIADNILKRQFNPDAANKACVSDITNVRTHEGFLYVATVIDVLLDGQ
jgi:putative transposase